MLGALETLLNQALEVEGSTSERLQALHGTVVRLRCERPTFSLYLLICEDGIEILENYEGHIDVRVRSSLGALLQWILTAGAPPEDNNIQITGADDTVDLLVRTLQAFDLWAALRLWLDQHVNMHDVLTLLRREDPRWLGTLERLSTDVSSLGEEIGRQRLLQEEILDEIRGLKNGLRRERRLDMISLLAGAALLFAAFASSDGQLPILMQDIQQGTQTLFLASLGLTLVLTRILFGHRSS